MQVEFWQFRFPGACVSGFQTVFVMASPLCACACLCLGMFGWKGRSRRDVKNTGKTYHDATRTGWLQVNVQNVQPSQNLEAELSVLAIRHLRHPQGRWDTL